MNRSWGQYGSVDTTPVEMRFVDMFMAAIGALIFISMVLLSILPEALKQKQEAAELRRQLELVRQDQIASPGLDSKLVRDYYTYQTTQTSRYGTAWNIIAGHRYFSSHQTKTNWTTAFCYVTRVIDGVKIRIDLAIRPSPNSAPTGPAASSGTLQKANLTASRAIALAKACPWLDDAHYTPQDFVPKRPTTNPYNEEPKIVLTGDVLRYQGPIVPNALDLIRNFEFKVLEINSPGGVVRAAIKVGRWLRDNDKAVLIGSECYSACPYLVAGGTLRALSKNSTVGVHQFYCKLCPPTEQQIQYTQNLMATLLEYLKAMGVSSDLLIATKNVPKDQMKVLQGATLRQWNLINTTSESSKWRIHVEDNLVLYRISDALNSGDFLNIRKAARKDGRGAEIVGKLSGNVGKILGTGRRKRFGSQEWVEIEYKDIRGWVNAYYLTQVK